MNFLADMGISPKTVNFLRNLGHDAVHLQEQGLERLSDPEILQKAQLEQRVLLTHDLDFGELMAASQSRLPSVIIFRLRNMRPDQVKSHLKMILQQHEELLEQGVIMSVIERHIRVRTLPIIDDAET